MACVRSYARKSEMERERESAREREGSRAGPILTFSVFQFFSVCAAEASTGPPLSCNS